MDTTTCDTLQSAVTIDIPTTSLSSPQCIITPFLGDLLGKKVETEGLNMAVQLNHTIVACHDKDASAHFLAHILGLETVPFAHFLTIPMANAISLDFDERDVVPPQHYAFLVDDAEFDAIFSRVQEASIPYYAFPGRNQPGELNHRDGGRGFYFQDPNGHSLEILTRPYGSGPQ